MTKDEVKAVTRERMKIRSRIQGRRVNALREISRLRPDQAYLAPEIARSALKAGRDPS
jgi:hypothetical protein